MRNPTSRNGSTSIQNGLLCGGGATMAAPRRKADPPLNAKYGWIGCRLGISDFGAYLLIDFHNGPLTPTGRKRVDRFIILLVYDPPYHLLHPHKPLPSREDLVLWMGLRPFRQVADTWPLRPAGNHSNPCGTQTYEASSNFDECKQPAGRKNLSSLLHKRRENGSTRFKIEFQIPPRRHTISPNRRALHSKGGIQMSETRC